MTPFSFVRNPTNIEEASAVRGLLLLRLIVLAATIVSLGIWHRTFAPYPYWIPTLLMTAALAAWSVFTYSSIDRRASSSALLRELLIDYAWVLLIVLLAGRTANPFIYYYLVLAALSATLTSAKTASALCSLGISIYSALLLFDIKGHLSHISYDYKLHLVGMWINFVGSSIIVSYFVIKLINMLRKQHQQMVNIREHNLKNEQLVGLATVSASTIHNLATPLSTLTTLTERIEQHYAVDDELPSDFQLMREQISRCRNTMSDLAYLVEQSDTQNTVAIGEIAANLDEHYALHFPDNPPKLTIEGDPNNKILCSPLLQYALINLINNALDSSPAQTSVRLISRGQALRVVITNRSPTSQRELSQKWGKPSPSSKDSGLGIGSFLANSTIERQGGSVAIEYQTLSDADTLVTVTVKIPLVSDYE